MYCPDWMAGIADIYCSQFWRLEVEDQGVGRFGFFQGLHLRLGDGHLLESSWGLSSVRALLWLSGAQMASYKDTKPDWIRAHLVSLALT